MNTIKSEAVFFAEGECITPLGWTLQKNIENLKADKSAITEVKDKNFAENPFYGAVLNKEKLNQKFENLAYQEEFSTLEKMILLASENIKNTYENALKDKCGLIISSTKGNITALENEDISAYFLSNLAQKIGKALKIKSQPIVLSNACVSGIMAISVAKRLIQSGAYNHFIVIGADLFSKFVFSGFQSFQAISKKPCKPYDKSRDGITLGEAAAVAFITKDKEKIKNKTYFEIIGDSSINDANHISGPSRTGEGLFQSIENAKKEADISAEKVACISSHGTATLYNDEMEAQAFTRAKLQEKPVFSLKGRFGHTLGAAGLLETVITLKFAEENLIPPSFNYEKHGLTLPLNISSTFQEKEMDIILKTASGFGGSNTAVLFKKHHS